MYVSVINYLIISTWVKHPTELGVIGLEVRVSPVQKSDFNLCETLPFSILIIMSNLESVCKVNRKSKRRKCSFAAITKKYL
jgi:hypothetical protein